MGRRKKYDDAFGYQDLFSEPIKEERWDSICPVCGKKFLKTSEHSYLIGNKYPCSWKCFLLKVKEWEEADRQKRANQPQRGRKPKEVSLEEEDDEDVL